MAREHRLDLRRIDVLAAGDDHVLQPVLEEHETVFIEIAGVAGVKPSAANSLRGFFLPLPITAHQALASIENLTDLARRQGGAFGLDEADTAAGHRPGP